MIKFNYILFFLLLLISDQLIGQTFSATIRKLSIEDGLSNRFVRCAFQDSRGFVWLGTKYGLNCYNGYSFDLFTKEKGGLASNHIQSICEDQDTCLWINYFGEEEKTLNRVDVLNLKTSEVRSLEEFFGNKLPFKEKEIFEIYQVAPQVIFIVTKDKNVFEYLGKGVFKERFTLPYPCHSLNQILSTASSFWVAGAGYFLEYDKSGTLKKQELVPFKSVLDLQFVDGELKGYARDLLDSLVVIRKVRQEDLDYEVLPLFSEDISTINSSSKIKQAPNGLIWYHDKDVSRMYSPKGELVYDFSEHLSDRTINAIYNIYFDNNNSAWIATSSGVFVLTIEKNRFNTYLNKDKFVPNSVGVSTRGIVEDENGFLYVNSYSGRKKLNPKTGEYVEAKDDSPNKSPELDALRDSKGNLWFCGETELVECFNPQTEEYRFYPCRIEGANIPNPTFRPMNIKLFEDSYQRMWLGTNDGVYYLDTVHQAFIKHHAYGLCTALNQSMVYTFYEDKVEKILWVGSSLGMFKYDYGSSRFSRHYASEKTQPYYIPHSYILCMHKDSKGDFYWLGTNEGGLIRWEPKSGRFDHYTVATGLSDNVIYGILEDESNHLWMSSNYGLMRFDKTTEWTTNYLPEDGITNVEFNTLSWFKSKSGRFYFGGINGLVSFFSKDFQKEEESDIPMHILKYEYLKGGAENLEDRTNELIRTPFIVMKPEDNYFRISFSLLDLRDPSRNKYSFRIDGFEQGWQYISENEIRINRLPQGSYTLIIRGQGFDGKWSRNQLRIPIKVEVPIYQTFYFWLWAATIMSLLVFLGVRIKIRNSELNKKYLEKEVANRTQTLLEREQDLLKAKEEAEKSSQAKAEFLSIMSHEIRTPMNAVVNLTNYLLEDNPTLKQTENLNILKFSANNLLAIINDVLDFNKIESGKVEFEQIDFDLLSLLDSIRYGMAVSAKEKNIEFVLEVPFELNEMLVGDPNRLTQILNNLISNAIKFTEKGCVRLKLTCLKDTDSASEIQFEVIDTGIGIAKEEMEYIFNMFTQAASDTTRKYGGTGLGLAITKRLLELQNSNIKLESTVGEGSNFSFVLTFSKGAKLKKVQELPKDDLNEALKGVKILVVEDNAVNVLVVKKFLKKWGVDFVHAKDGLEALDKVKQDSFDLILMDIHMPNMDGYTATKIIRAMEEEHYTKVPIIALTASALMDNKGKVYESGMNDIVVKPFKPKELYKTLIKHL